jgi:multiple sugar transport system substrate-binding protein
MVVRPGSEHVAAPGLTRRRFLGALGSAAGGVAAAGLLSACGGSSGGGAKGGSGSTTLSFVYMGTAEQQASWNKLFAKFREKNPSIDLKAEAIPSNNWADFFNKVSTRVAGGRVPDMLQVATEGQRLFASKGLVAPLDDFIAKDKAIIDEYYADLDPNLIKWNKEHSSPDGKTYYLPGEFNTMAIWYSKELFQKAGVAEPTSSWTWDDFRRACEQIKAKTGAWGYADDATYFVGIMPWLLTNGASSFNDDWSKPTIDSPAAQEAAAFVQSLVRDKLAPPPGGTFDAFTAMAQGKVAMFGGGQWPIINIRNLKIVDKVGIVPWPVKVKQGSPVGWNGYPIMNSSKNKEAGWTFVKFLISKEGSSFFAQLGGTIVPARKSVASSQQYLQNSPTGIDKLYKALSYATPIPSPDKGAVIQKDIEDTFKQIYVGNAQPGTALTSLQATLQGLV